MERGEEVTAADVSGMKAGCGKVGCLQLEIAIRAGRDNKAAGEVLPQHGAKAMLQALGRSLPEGSGNVRIVGKVEYQAAIALRCGGAVERYNIARAGHTLCSPFLTSGSSCRVAVWIFACHSHAGERYTRARPAATNKGLTTRKMA